jgi:hypothetical protein
VWLWKHRRLGSRAAFRDLARLYLANSSCTGGVSTRPRLTVVTARSSRVRETLSVGHLGLLARAERHLVAGADGARGWKSYEMVLRYAHLAPEKLSSVAGRIERQPLRLVEGAPRSANVAKNATFCYVR